MIMHIHCEMIATVKLMTDYHHTYVIIFFLGGCVGKTVKIYSVPDFRLQY